MDCLKLAHDAIRRRNQKPAADYTLTAYQAAGILGCTHSAVIYALAAGAIVGQKRNRQWRICPDSVAAYNPCTGRPRGGRA